MILFKYKPLLEINDNGGIDVPQSILPSVKLDDASQLPKELTSFLMEKIKEDPRPITVTVRTLLNPQEETDLKAIAEELTKISAQEINQPQGPDVHTITRVFCQKYYPILEKIEKKYLSQPLLPLMMPLHYGTGPGLMEAIKAKVVDYLKEQNSLDDKSPNGQTFGSNIDTVFARIKSYWNNPIDGETKQDLTQVLQRVVGLAEQFPKNGWFSALCYNLEENILTNGGCHPGVTGRLITLYAAIVPDYLSELSVVSALKNEEVEKTEAQGLTNEQVGGVTKIDAGFDGGITPDIVKNDKDVGPANLGEQKEKENQGEIQELLLTEDRSDNKVGNQDKEVKNQAKAESTPHK